MTRKIIYVTGTRADFGLVETILRRLQHDPDVELSICVTGMHLSQKFGMTVHEIEDAHSKQCIENIGKNELKFLCIVDPAWKHEDETILE